VAVSKAATNTAASSTVISRTARTKASISSR
jgi:hypothetical protein